MGWPAPSSSRVGPNRQKPACRPSPPSAGYPAAAARAGVARAPACSPRSSGRYESESGRERRRATRQRGFGDRCRVVRRSGPDVHERATASHALAAISHPPFDRSHARCAWQSPRRPRRDLAAADKSRSVVRVFGAERRPGSVRISAPTIPPRAETPSDAFRRKGRAGRPKSPQAFIASHTATRTYSYAMTVSLALTLAFCRAAWLARRAVGDGQHPHICHARFHRANVHVQPRRTVGTARARRRSATRCYGSTELRPLPDGAKHLALELAEGSQLRPRRFLISLGNIVSRCSPSSHVVVRRCAE